MADDAELRGGLDLVHVPLFFLELRVASASREAVRRSPRSCRWGPRRIGSWRAARGRSRTPTGASPGGCAGAREVRCRRSGGGCSPRGRSRACGSCRAASTRSFRCCGGACRWRRLRPGFTGRPAGLGSLATNTARCRSSCSLRKQNTAVPGTVEQGKTSYLVATVAEDLERERCAVILFDPKGDAADAAVSLVDALADVHGARPRPSDVRVQPARGGRAGRRDRRLRRRRRSRTSSRTPTSGRPRTATCATR